MSKLIIASCLMLFWVFYEMSGGSDFQPRERVVASQAPFEKPANRHVAYQKPITTAAVIDATYTPVTTQPLDDVQPVQVLAAVIIPQDTVAAAIVPTQTEPTLDLRRVSGDRVNLRAGPGTNHRVIDTLSQGTMAEIIAANDDGWAQIRLIETGQTGWMAKRLLSEG